MIERILKLIQDSGITAYKLTTDLGFGSGTISIWKNGKAKPNTDAIIKLAEYFNVSTDYLLTGNEYQTDINIQNVESLQGELSKEETEILRIYNALDFKQRVKFLNYAIELEEANNNKPVTDKKLVYRAARSSNNAEPQMIEMSQDEIDKIRNASEVTEI